MKRFATSTTIRARPETIWALLTDAAGFAGWNSTVDRVDGNIAPGERVKVYAKASPGRAFALNVQPSFDAFAADLKRRAEQTA